MASNSLVIFFAIYVGQWFIGPYKTLRFACIMFLDSNNLRYFSDNDFVLKNVIKK